MLNIPSDNSAQPLSLSLYQKIQRDILSGEISSGSKLTEQKLCKKYNVSRTPIREAFRQLEADGIIENIPNRGAFAVGLSNRDISDLFDLRCLFEIQAVEWAIQRMTDEEVDALKETVEFMEFYTLKDDSEKIQSFNSKFHHILYEGTKDKILQKSLSIFQTYLKYSAPSKDYETENLKLILKEHKSIFEAIEARNIHAGIKAMQHHMQQSKIRRMAQFF